MGKSILSQALAVESTKAGLKTLLFDYDLKQATSKTLWWEDRLKNGIKPFIDAIASENLETKSFLEYDLIIIDGPANTTKSTINISFHSDLVFQPTSPTNADIKTAILAFNTLVKHGVDNKKMFLVFNQVLTDSQENKARKKLSIEYPHYKVIDGSIPTRVTYANAQDEGKAITEINHESLLARAKNLISSLVKEIVNRNKEKKL